MPRTCWRHGPPNSAHRAQEAKTERMSSLMGYIHLLLNVVAEAAGYASYATLLVGIKEGAQERAGIHFQQFCRLYAMIRLSYATKAIARKSLHRYYVA